MSELAANEPLLIIAILAILAATAGWMVERDRPALARALRGTGYLGMLAAGLLLVGQLAYSAEHSDADLMLNSRPKLTVEGKETVIPMAADGHFWVEAEVNGKRQEFLIDTGATVTGLSRDAGSNAGIAPDPGKLAYEVNTANGTIWVNQGTAASIEFGSIKARNLEVAVPRDLDDDTNVIGMNLLSQLASWRVEGERLILVPKE
jgi:aspartyl protease family protein